MGLLEETIRDTFAHRAGVPPATDGLADRAIAGAQRVRRRRSVVASAAAVLSVALLAFGALTVATRPGHQASDTAAGPTGAATLESTLPVEIVVDGTVYQSVDGRLRLPDLGAGSVQQVWRMATGYLVAMYVSGAQASASLWYVPTSDPLTNTPSMIENGEAVMVAAGTPQRPGIQVAWRDDAGVHVGVFIGGTVADTVTTQVPDVDLSGVDWSARLYPTTVVGGAVVLAGTATGSGLGVSDVWFPARGDYVSTAVAAPFSAMLAVTPDGEHIIGTYHPTKGDKASCLGEYDPDGFALVNQLCPSLFSLDGKLLPSPDGRWWLVIDPTQVRLYDAQRVWQGAGPVRTWPMAGVENGGWADGGTALLTTPDSVLVMRTDSAVLNEITLPDATTPPIVVADLR